MKLLWITNITFPEALDRLEIYQHSSVGGWMLSSANTLVNHADIDLYVASVSRHVRQLTRVKGSKIKYYLIPYGKGNERENREYEFYWKEIAAEVIPDVVHIHGTEFTHGLSYVKACGANRVIVSIQGLLHIIAHYSTCGISYREILANYTFRDFLLGSSLISEQKTFIKRSKYEIELLRLVRHVIGRTVWDKVHALAVNPSLNYHYCNESLRDVFYEGLWEYNKCLKHSIFLSQGSSALKGMHMVLKALPIVLEKYPDTMVRIAGKNPAERKSYWDKLSITGYGKYISKLIKRKNLEDHIVFLGPLSDEQMKQEYLSANVFICPSSIENSPNSLGEAQILGVPCIGSYVGGIPDFILSDDYGIIYRYDDIEMIGNAICTQFSKSVNFDNTTMRNEAMKRHDKNINEKTLLNIYKSIIENE